MLPHQQAGARTAVIIDNYDLVDARHPIAPSDTDAEIDLDSHCREIARDLVLTCRGFKGRTWPEDVAKVFASDHPLEHGDLIATFVLDGAYAKMHDDCGSVRARGKSDQ